MAAVVHLPRPRPAARPDLRVLAGGRSAAARHRRRTYLRRRLVAAAVLAVVVVGLAHLGSAVVGALGGGPAASGPARPLPEAVVAQPGDSLWSIAAELGLEGDLRGPVGRLTEANGGAALTAGQLVRIPADLR